MADDVKILSVTDFIVTETIIDPKSAMSDVERLLREEKSTGKVQFDVSRGGHQRFLLVEKTKLNDANSSKIRQLLGWKNGE
jgi:hypothetical protein